MSKKSWYEMINSENDIRSNVGYDYEGKIFDKTLSNHVTSGDSNRMEILASIEKVIINFLKQQNILRTILIIQFLKITST